MSSQYTSGNHHPHGIDEDFDPSSQTMTDNDLDTTSTNNDDTNNDNNNNTEKSILELFKSDFNHLESTLLATLRHYEHINQSYERLKKQSDQVVADLTTTQVECSATQHALNFSLRKQEELMDKIKLLQSTIIHKDGLLAQANVDVQTLLSTKQELKSNFVDLETRTRAEINRLKHDYEKRGKESEVLAKRYSELTQSSQHEVYSLQVQLQQLNHIQQNYNTLYTEKVSLEDEVVQLRGEIATLRNQVATGMNNTAHDRSLLFDDDDDFLHQASNLPPLPQSKGIGFARQQRQQQTQPQQAAPQRGRKKTSDKTTTQSKSKTATTNKTEPTTTDHDGLNAKLGLFKSNAKPPSRQKSKANHDLYTTSGSAGGGNFLDSDDSIDLLDSPFASQTPIPQTKEIPTKATARDINKTPNKGSTKANTKTPSLLADRFANMSSDSDNDLLPPHIFKSAVTHSNNQQSLTLGEVDIENSPQGHNTIDRFRQKTISKPSGQFTTDENLPPPPMAFKNRITASTTAAARKRLNSTKMNDDQ